MNLKLLLITTKKPFNFKELNEDLLVNEGNILLYNQPYYSQDADGKINLHFILNFLKLTVSK